MMAGMEAGTPAAPSRRRARLSRDVLEAEFNRLLAFSDGVFAIAITLLLSTTAAIAIWVADQAIGPRLFRRRAERDEAEYSQR
jgi:hypothetical protein